MLRRSVGPALIFSSAMLIVCFAGCSSSDSDLRILGFQRASDAAAPPSLAPSGNDTAPIPDPDAGLCNAYECPAPYATCPGTSGVCTTNLSTDFHHCGSCDIECPPSPLGLDISFVCAESRCQMICNQGSGDCNGLVDDGCEIDLDADPANCGSCGVQCAAGELCWQGACGCPPGYSECDGQCMHLSDDPGNCGACGNICSGDDPGEWTCGVDVQPPGTSFGCTNAQCGQQCAPEFGNCNTDFCGDGCETRLSEDPNNCGACGHACSPEQTCIGGRCLCDPGSTLCGFECANLQSDPMNCGACGNVCPGFNGGDTTATGAPVCVLGRCSYACAVGHGDCDNHIDNGCEVDLTIDPRNCGSCGTQCDLAGGQPCSAGRCLMKPCDAGVLN